MTARGVARRLNRARRGPDHVFRDTALANDALLPLIEADPAAAKNLLIALLARDYDDTDDPLMRIHHLGFHDPHQWFPPTFFTGPFLHFLRVHPEQGVDLIVTLVNIAADRLERYESRAGDQASQLHLESPNGPRTMFADFRIYGWFRDFPPAPHGVVAALMALEKWLYDEVDAGRDIAAHVRTILASSTNVAFLGVLVALAKRHPLLLSGPLVSLLEVPELYAWDDRLAMEGSGHLMMSWGLRHEPEHVVKLVAEFHQMPHKSGSLRHLSTMLLLNYSDFGPIFLEARQKWHSHLTNLQPDDPQRDRLEALCAQHNPANYRVVAGEDGTKCWQFDAPPALKARWQESDGELQEKRLLLTFPSQCRQLLDGESSLSDSELETFWKTVCRLAEMRTPDDEDGFLQPIDGVCGGIAVLMRHHSAWLEAVEGRSAWCVSRLTAIVQSPPQPSPYDSEVSSADWTWDRFCADILPSLWARNPASHELRSAIGRLAFTRHYHSVAALMRSASEFRGTLRKDFERLEHLVLRAAAPRFALAQASHTNSDIRPLEAEADAALEGFVNGTLPSKLPSLDELARPLRRFSDMDPDDAADGPRAYVDMDAVGHAFSWLPAMTEAVTIQERERWLTFYADALAYVLRRTPPSHGDEHRTPSLPYDSDRWVLKRVAAVVLQVSPIDAATFWRPILDLPISAQHWIEEFVRSFLLHGLGPDVTPTTFAARWKDMVTYAIESPVWNERDGWWRRDELWCKLMGLDSLLKRLWRKELTALVTTMRPEFEAWRKKCLARPHCAREFVYFLTAPAALEMLPQGLVWLNEASTSRQFWREHGMESGVSESLEVAWRTARAPLQASPVAFSAFRSLLKALADRQNPLALELQTRLTTA
jgi:hypothetical protein